MKELLEIFPILGRRQSQKAGLLSGGEHQMLAIAIGWLSQPQIMLLDEPERRLGAGHRRGSLPDPARLARAGRRVRGKSTLMKAIMGARSIPIFVLRGSIL